MSTRVTIKGKQITLELDIPLPLPKLPGIPISWPPHLPDLTLPGVSKALEALSKVLLEVQRVIVKLMKLIPQASIHLIIKVGKATIVDQVIETPSIV